MTTKLWEKSYVKIACVSFSPSHQGRFSTTSFGLLMDTRSTLLE
ncbi:MAG: hypothetical protein SH856_07875 [Flavobacteriales bacterium]|nr:hypothetical protein [Flavobacteriales bacterium]